MECGLQLPWRKHYSVLHFLTSSALSGLGRDWLHGGSPASEWLPLDPRRLWPHPIIDNGRHGMNLPDAPIAHEGFFAAHFVTVRDQEKSKDFYVRILGGKLIKPDNPCYIKLANTWIILNCGGGPTPDKPEVILETPSDLNRVNSFLNLRVADIRACYTEWGDKGAFFLTEPLPNPDGWEWRCYMRDPDGYLIEVGQYTQLALDWFNNHR
jgi:catechol 2,3-dioxygenase-like lactoylglutathione lyase family enzyme